jgi:thiamine-monophosphate kinase
MAGEPMAAIVSLAKPKNCSDEVLKGVFVGMNRLAERFGCPIVGGDTSSSAEGLIIDVCLLGKCEKNEPVLRSGAKFGDFIYVTGPLGGSILGKHLNFTPRIDEALWLVDHLHLSAMIDISDGISSDLAHLCEESHCGAELFSHYLDIIVSDEAHRLAEKIGGSPLEHALNDGEDFELLFTSPVSPSELPELPTSIQLFPIGRIIDRRDVSIIYPDGRQTALRPTGFRHF